MTYFDTDVLIHFVIYQDEEKHKEAQVCINYTTPLIAQFHN